MSQVNLYVDQGLSFAARMTIHHQDDTPVDLTGATIRAQYRKSSTSPLVFDIVAEIEDHLAGTVILSLTKEQTAAMSAGRYIYAGDYILGADCIRFVIGQIVVSPRVTQ